MVRCTQCHKPFIGLKALASSLSSVKAADSPDRELQKLLYQCGVLMARPLRKPAKMSLRYGSQKLR
jgi:hypothetical protein